MDNKTYYENFDWESSNLAERLRQKIEIIKSLIPKDVVTIADIGCGDGSISNRLAKDYKLFAFDRSKNALKYLTTHKAQASADFLPLKTNSVDLLFSSELIEHLPNNIFELAIQEFKRVAKKYILLTFPNNENIEKNLVQCTNCMHFFNKSYHLRSINQVIVESLFDEFNIIKSFRIGHRIRSYNNFLLKIKHKYSPPSSWIPKHWTPDGRRQTMCPKCGNAFQIEYKFNLISFVCDSLNTFISPKIPYQLCILLKKKDV